MKNNTDFKLICVIGAILILIIAGTVMAYVKSQSDRYAKYVDKKSEVIVSESINENTDADKSNCDSSKKEEDKDKSKEKNDELKKIFDSVYYDYIDENVQYFENGMVMCDLNEDGLPEVFSITNTNETLPSLIFHEFKDGKIIKPSGDIPTAHIDMDTLIMKNTFWLSPKFFSGVYRHKTTNEKSIIISAMIHDEHSEFDIITYDGNNLRVEHRADEINQYDKEVSFFDKIDRIMKNYELCDEKLYSGVQLRGAVDAGGVKATFDELMSEFKSGKGEEYGDVLNGEVECYIRNIDLKDNEIELVPVAKISYEEFENAKNNNGAFELNGESAKIIWNDENIYDSEVYMMPWFSYYFESPLDPGSESLIAEYFGNKPFKVKMSDDFRIIYEPAALLGAINLKEEYTAEEYLPQYAARKMLNCSVAQINDGVISSLKILYHP